MVTEVVWSIHSCSVNTYIHTPFQSHIH